MTLGDADFRKSPMKMTYRKLPKIAALPVTCHRFSSSDSAILTSMMMKLNDNIRLNDKSVSSLSQGNG